MFPSTLKIKIENEDWIQENVNGSCFFLKNI